MNISTFNQTNPSETEFTWFSTNDKFKCNSNLFCNSQCFNSADFFIVLFKPSGYDYCLNNYYEYSHEAHELICQYEEAYYLTAYTGL